MSIQSKWILRSVLTALCGLAVGFILYNSLQPAVESAQQSGRIVAMVQRVAVVIAPHSTIANATGEAYLRLHEAVRTLAHFAEYALLGMLGGWCCLSYTAKKAFYAIPMASVAVLGVLDECLQTLAIGRGAQILDVLVDISGGCVGWAVAYFTVYFIVKIIKRREHETR